MAKKNEMNDKQRELYSEMQKLAKTANQRLLELERNFGKNTWASRKLKERLEAEKVQAFTKSGRISTRSDMSIPQMRATINATKQFLNSQTSTIRGIKKTRENVKTAMSISADISYSVAEIVQRIWEDKQITKIPKYIKGSDFINLIADMIDRDRDVKQTIYQYEDETDEEFKERLDKARQEEFLNSLNEYISGAESDESLKEEARRILNKYFK